MEFSDKLLQIRRTLGLSQQQLAEKLGISRSAVLRLENGHFQPSKATKAKINSLFDSMTSLEEINGSSPSSTPSTTDIKTDVSNIVEMAKQVTTRYINVALLRRNFLIGKRIDEEILTTRAEDYGTEIIKNLSAFLSEKYGEGFTKTNLYYYLCFAQRFPNIFHAASGKSFLSWTHYRVLLTVNNDTARSYYEREALASGWSVKQLQRAIVSQHYERLLSTQGAENIPLPEGEKPSTNPLEYIKNPFVAEFLGLPNPDAVSESELEQAILNNLAQFMLEMGKGYAFIASQKRIHTGKKDYYVDLVFYNYYLRCFVLIDLKTATITHQDVGQMDMYVRMFDEEFRSQDDNPTIGILLCADTDEDIARYSILKGSEQIFAAKYTPYMPDEEELKREIDRQKALFLLSHGSKSAVKRP